MNERKILAFLTHPSALIPHPLLFWRRVRDSNSHTALSRRSPIFGTGALPVEANPPRSEFEGDWQGCSDLN